MNAAADLLRTLRQRGVRLWAEGDSLHYSAPSGSFDAELRERVAENRGALIEWLASKGGASTPIRRPESGGAHRASVAQHRMWFLERIAPGSYNCPAVVLLGNTGGVSGVKAAISSLIKRHEALHTVFRLDGGDLMQLVQPSFDVDVPIQHAQSTSEAQTIADRFFSRRFDLAKGPLIFAAVVDVNGCAYLLLMLHHIITDGWSMGIVASDLRRLLAKENLPEVEWQYADFAAWQNLELSARIRPQQLNWWERQLANAPAALDLPTDRPRPAMFPSKGAIYRFVLPGDLTCEEVERAAKRFGVTPYMLLLAAFQVLLFRYTSAEDICVGTPVANRVRPEFTGTVGCFINTVVIRARPQPFKLFSEFLREVREAVVGAFSHQELPFESLVEHLRLPRDTSRHPVFQVMFVLQTSEGAEYTHLGEADSPIRVEDVGAKFDLNVSLVSINGSYHLECEYASELYDAHTVRQLFGHYENMLRCVINSPDSPIGLIDYLGSADRSRVESACVGHVEPLDDDTLMRRLERQALATPDAVAVRYGDRTLTFADLHGEANALAMHLSEVGVRRGAICALVMDRSIAMVRSILAVMKCGAAYLPIDPATPKLRVSYILNDANVAAVLVQQQYAESVDGGASPVVLCDDSPYSKAGPAATSLNGRDWAYVIYTSGTTGQPKGVVNHHAGLLNRINWMQRNFPIGMEDVVLQKTNYAFDVSVWEFLWPLSCGASLVLAEPGGHRDPRYIAELIGRAAVTVVHFVPSMLAQFTSVVSPQELSSLRAVFASGEALSVGHLAQFRALGLTAKLFNLYGPTEAAIDVTAWDCDDAPAHSELMPIGRPIDNTDIRILDTLGQEVPPGVWGELCIGGVGVASGYIGRPRLTAESFVPHPSGNGSRLYRTGDRARWRHEGVLEYYGRFDFQVKLRGFRIELGEIEAHLMALPGIVNAAAIVSRYPSGEQCLLAYVERNGEAGEHPATEPAWKEALRQSLPDYMVPMRIIALDSLPLNANGKLDRNSLMQRPIDLNVAVAEVIEANGETERRLREIWSGILGQAQISVTTNFFDAGGTSLLMAVVQQKVREELGQEVPLVQFFSNPTIRDFAAYLNGQSIASSVSSDVERRVQGMALLAKMRNRAAQGGNDDPSTYPE